MRVRDLPLRTALSAYETASAVVSEPIEESTVEQCLRTAARGRVTAYDAEFVWLAEVSGVPLVTSGLRSPALSPSA